MLLVFDQYSYDATKRELRRGDELVKIDPQQLDLLVMFLKHPGELLSRHQIVDCVWEGRTIADSVLSVSIAKLRKVLGRPHKGGNFIESRYGRGYRFVHAVKAIQASEQPAAARPEWSLVGRAAALEQLNAAAEQAQHGRGRVCLISGEPGIGKTRLAECFELTARDRGHALVVWARCQADASVPLWPIWQLMRELAKHGLRASPALDMKELDYGALDLLAQELISASRRRPLLLIVDDLQWADSASLRVLTFLADHIVAAPILLVCALRYGDQPADVQREVLRLCNHRNCQRIELQRLSLQDVTQYVRSRFGKQLAEQAELSRTLHARSEGNPFLMIDLLSAAEPTKRLSFSRPALDAVRERLRGLPDETRQALRAAAVIGHDFDIGLVSHVTGSRPELTLNALACSLVNQTLRSTPASVGVFSFDHELTREVLYEELSPQERGQLHLQVAEGLLQRRAHGGEVTNSELAEHFLAAQPFGDVENAIAYAQTAATEASRQAAHAHASQILLRALEVLRFRVAPRPELRAALLLQLALAKRVQGDPTYRVHLENAVSIAREHRLGRLLTFAGRMLSWSPDHVAHEDAASVLEAADQSLEADDYEHLAIVRATLAWTPPNSHSARRVDELIRQSQAFADKSSSPHARAALDDALLFFSAGPDTLQQAEQLAEQIEQACEQHPAVASRARRILVARFRLIRGMQLGDQLAVARAIEVLAALLTRLRNAELSWHLERILLVKAMNEGTFLQVKADLIALRERASRQELHASQLLWSLDYGVFMCRTGDVSELAARARRTLQPGAHDSPQTRAGKIRSMVDFGLLEDVATALSQISTAAIEDLPRGRDYLAVLCSLAAGAAAARSVKHCELLARLLSPYSSYYAAGVSFHCHGSVASHLGLLYEALGRPDLAREHYAQGLEREQAFGLMPCAALTGMRLARLLLCDHSDREDGLRLLEHVRAEAERMGMEPLAHSARELARTAQLDQSGCASGTGREL